jgi:hypothetical protein
VETFARIAQTIGFLLASFLAATWSLFPDRKGQFFVRMFLYLSWALSFCLLCAWLNPASRNREERFCTSNASPQRQEDGQYCAAQGFFLQVSSRI